LAPNSQHLRVPGSITLLPLPPYAPELNPIANLREYLCGNRLSLRIWDTYEAIRDTCCAAWNALIADRDRTVSINKRDWPSANFQGRWYASAIAPDHRAAELREFLR
jgi:transposase